MNLKRRMLRYRNRDRHDEKKRFVHEYFFNPLVKIVCLYELLEKHDERN